MSPFTFSAYNVNLAKESNICNGLKVLYIKTHYGVLLFQL